MMKVILGAVIGGVIGFVIGYFGRCVSGVCPLAGNPFITSVIGALAGAMLAFPK